MAKLTCEQAKQLDMVDYLQSIGHLPKKIRNNDYWYLSPFRKKHTPSFKVNRQFNLWFDHGTGEGGNFIDFGIRYFNCSVTQLLRKLETYCARPGFSFHPPTNHSVSQDAPAIACEKKKDETSRITVMEVRPLKNAALLSYLQSRGISINAATKHCREIDFRLYGKMHTAIGFKNDSGGYELRSSSFKGASSPKDITLIQSGAKKGEVSVLEGFTDFLSLLTLEDDKKDMDFLVLNSLAFVTKGIDILKDFDDVLLYLDHDIAGREATLKLLHALPRARDMSQSYKEHKDLNEFLKHLPRQKEQKAVTQRQKPKHGLGR